MSIPPFNPAPYSLTDAVSSSLGSIGGFLFSLYGLMALGIFLVLVVLFDFSMEMFKSAGHPITPWGSAIMRLIEAASGPGDPDTGQVAFMRDVKFDTGRGEVSLGHYNYAQGGVEVDLHDGGPPIVRYPGNLYDRTGIHIAAVDDMKGELDIPIEAVTGGKSYTIKRRRNENARLVKEVEFLGETIKNMRSDLSSSQDTSLQMMLNMANQLGQIKDKMGWKQSSFMPPGKMTAAGLAAAQEGGE